jgi:DHA1 family tetracycline resistance protein-like MFS transporter
VSTDGRYVTGRRRAAEGGPIKAFLPHGARHRAALGFILVTVALDMLATAIVIPFLPNLILEFVGGDTVRAAGWFGLFGTVWALMQFLCAPLQGALSDRFGRRPVILLSNFGLGLDYILMALAPTLGVLLLGRIVSGAAAASVSTTGAYIADVLPPDRRAAGFGMINVAVGLGLVLGPALGGVLGGLDPRLPFWVAAGLSLLNGAYGLAILPESLPRANRARFSWRRANPIGALGVLRADPVLVGLGAVNFLGALAQQALPAVFVLYTGYRYGWDARTVGMALAFLGICFIVGSALVQPVVRRLGERRAMLAGLAAGACGFAIFALAPTGHILELGIPVMAFWSLGSAVTQGLMSRRVAASEQGRLQSAGSSLTGVAGLLGPGLFTGIFAVSIAGFHGLIVPAAPFLAAMLSMVGAAVLAAWVTAPHREAGSDCSIDKAAK